MPNNCANAEKQMKQPGIENGREHIEGVSNKKRQRKASFCKIHRPIGRMILLSSTLCCLFSGWGDSVHSVSVHGCYTRQSTHVDYHALQKGFLSSTFCYISKPTLIGPIPYSLAWFYVNTKGSFKVDGEQKT